ncbi:MAG: HNH endonuclease [Acidimicrobiia bacterium]
MDWGKLTEDQLDQLLVRGEREMAVWRAVQMGVVAEKRRRGSHIADGHRSIVDWVAARADVAQDTARRICWTATRLADAPEVAEELAAGDLSFDRAELVARLPASHRGGHEAYDIGQLRRLVAHHRRLTRKREKRVSSNGYLHLATTSDQLMTALWGELPGLEARIVEKAVDQRADEIVPSDTRLAVAERRALALISICQDSLYDPAPGSESPLVEVVVTVDARAAAPSNGETGVSVLAGPRIGPRALEEILCGGMVQVIGIGEQGEPIGLGRRSRTVDRKLRRHVLDRDGGCTVDGCPFHYRLEVHHVTPWSHGGKTDAEDLITLCWFHHHVSVHREGLQVQRIGQSRVRLKRPR